MTSPPPNSTGMVAVTSDAVKPFVNRFYWCEDGMEQDPYGHYVAASDYDALLSAYDAKCEDLARHAELDRNAGVRWRAHMDAHDEVVRERDTLRAELDAVVRERDGLREALKCARVYIARPSKEFDSGRNTALNTIDAASRTLPVRSYRPHVRPVGVITRAVLGSLAFECVVAVAAWLLAVAI